MCLAIPGKIMRLLDKVPLSRMAEVSFSGARKVISLAFVPEAGVGDYVVVHAGVAISLLDEREAAETLDYLQQINEAVKLEDGR